MDKQEKSKLGQKAVEKTALIILAMAILKGAIGLVTGSSILLTDALHSLTDVISIATSWLGLKISQRKADEKFAYGYFKAENITALVVSIFIIFMGWQFLKEGWSRLFVLPDLKIPLLALAIALVAAITDFFLSRYLFKIAEQLNSPTLKASAQDKKNDILISATVALGILLTLFDLPYVEGVITILISFLLIKAGLQLARDNILVLMDIGPEPKIKTEINKVIESIEGVEQCLDLRLRQSGPYLFGDVKIGIRRKIDVIRSHQICQKVENSVKAKFPQIDHLSVHVEPFTSNFEHLVIPVKSDKDLNVQVEPIFGRAKFLLFINLQKNKVKGFYFIKNPYINEKQKAGLKLAKIIMQQKAGVLITAQIGEIALYALKEYLVDVCQLKGKTAHQVVTNFISKKLKVIAQAKNL